MPFPPGSSFLAICIFGKRRARPQRRPPGPKSACSCRKGVRIFELVRVWEECNLFRRRGPVAYRISTHQSAQKFTFVLNERMSRPNKGVVLSGDRDDSD